MSHFPAQVVVLVHLQVLGRMVGDNHFGHQSRTNLSSWTVSELFQTENGTFQRVATFRMLAQILWKETSETRIKRNIIDFGTRNLSLLESFLANLVSVTGRTSAMSSLPFSIRAQGFDTVTARLLVVQKWVINHIDSIFDL